MSRKGKSWISNGSGGALPPTAAPSSGGVGQLPEGAEAFLGNK